MDCVGEDDFLVWGGAGEFDFLFWNRAAGDDFLVWKTECGLTRTTSSLVGGGASVFLPVG